MSFEKNKLEFQLHSLGKEHAKILQALGESRDNNLQLIEELETGKSADDSTTLPSSKKVSSS